jgi:hypothetical protein
MCDGVAPFPHLVGAPGANRQCPGGGTGLALARRRRSRGVGCPRTHFSRRTHRRVVGLRSRGWPLRDTRTGEAGSGEHRSTESAGAQHFLSAEEAAEPELQASRKQPASRSQPRPGAQTLHFAPLDRAKLQAAKELPRLGSLPGTQGPIHPRRHWHLVW